MEIDNEYCDDCDGQRKDEDEDAGEGSALKTQAIKFFRSDIAKDEAALHWQDCMKDSRLLSSASCKPTQPFTIVLIADATMYSDFGSIAHFIPRPKTRQNQSPSLYYHHLLHKCKLERQFQNFHSLLSQQQP